MARKRITLENIILRTQRYGGARAIAHAARLLRLVQEIGVGLDYDLEALTISIYLHDWGRFPRFAQHDVEHSLRSRQVAESEILPFMQLSPYQNELVLEAVERHDYNDLRPTTFVEARLLREADMLEYIGAIGIAREFARGPEDLSVAYRWIADRRSGIAGQFSLPRAREMAKVRLERMDQILAWLGEEDFGIL